MKTTFIILISVLCLNSCTKEIDIDTLELERKIVVSSLFTPSKPFEFNFSYTTHTTDSFHTFTDSIHLWLYEDGKNLIDTIFLSNTFTIDIYPKYDSAYDLKLFVQGYDTIFASDKMPKRVKITGGSKKHISTDKYMMHTYRTEISFTDPVNESNYYELYFENAQYDTENKITDPVLVNEGDISFYPNTYFFSDMLFNGKQYSLIVNRNLGHINDSKVILRNISYAYYMYRKYWTRHSYNQIAVDMEIGALIYRGQPQPMYNNILNGYGVFAAYIENQPFVLLNIKN